MAGWFDSYAGANFINFNGMVKDTRTEESRRSQKIVVGPWSHALAVSTKLGQVEFGPDAMVDLLADELRWFDYWLKGIDNGVMDEPPVRIFVMGENAWRHEHEWPLARTQFTHYYLHGQGGAGQIVSDGTLTTEPPIETPTTATSTIRATRCRRWAGNHEVLPDLMRRRPMGSAPIEAGRMFWYTPAPSWIKTSKVTGPVVARLYASSSAPDTDFTARLVDVHTDGRAMVLCEGVCGHVSGIR